MLPDASPVPFDPKAINAAGTVPELVTLAKHLRQWATDAVAETNELKNSAAQTPPRPADLLAASHPASEGNLLTSNPETSGRYHSSWLSMMYPRLFLARQLLREDGAIFVSIDDNEVHHLRLLMNEVFGEENFVAQVTVVNNLKGRND